MSRRHETVVGRIPVLECLRARKRAAHKLFVLDGGRGLEDIVQAAGKLPVETHARTALERLAGGAEHQGVVLHADPLPVLKLDTWLAGVQTPDALAVVLDGIEDPHNFGAIIRSAAAFQAAGVIFGKRRAAPLSTAAVKAAAGGVEHVDLVQVPNIPRALGVLKEQQFWTVALEADGPQLLWEADCTGRMALAIGSEGHGLHRLVKERCDMHLRIPLGGAITSLNASVGAGVALAECRRQQEAQRKG